MPRFRPLPMRDICIQCGDATLAADNIYATETSDRRWVRFPLHDACIKPLRKRLKKWEKPEPAAVPSPPVAVNANPLEPCPSYYRGGSGLLHECNGFAGHSGRHACNRLHDYDGVTWS